MAEYIERDSIGIGKCNPDIFEDKGYAKGWNSAIDIIQNAPAADVRSVVHGEWVVGAIKDSILGDVKTLTCSICGYEYGEIFRNPLHKFCPNCGADMREES